MPQINLRHFLLPGFNTSWGNQAALKINGLLSFCRKI